MKDRKSSTIWGGRFSQGPAAIMERINASIDFDKRLYAQDIAGSQAHAQMLAKQGIISPEDNQAIQKGLSQIKEEIEKGEFNFQTALEDIHMNIESRLAEIIGKPAGRLHTARSRNDQVALDFRLWVRDASDNSIALLKALIKVLLDRAEEHNDTLMPGFTHLQTAQPVTLGHHFMAYVEMLGRDLGRFQDARARMNQCPLGAAALAGTSFPIDRHMVAEALGFKEPVPNSLDAVSSRDFALEVLGAASICAMHLSRLAEELVIWTSSQFRFVNLSDAFTTGSSIMPQKRNPDAAELIRAKIGRIMGSFTALLMVMKGLPLAYGKDMQEDKEPTFAAFDALELSLAAMTGMLEDISFNKERLRENAGTGFANATDLADWLVQRLGIPFREAHHITGRIVKMAENKGCNLEDLNLAEMQSVEAGISQEIFSVLGVARSVESRVSFGGTAPIRVKEAIAQARLKFLA